MKSNIPLYGIEQFTENSNEKLFYSNDLSNHLKNHLFVNAPHKHSTYITILFMEGKGQHQIDFDTYEIRPGSVFVLNPGQVHCWSISADAGGYIFFHTKEFYNNIFLNKNIEEYPFFFLQKNYPVIYLEKDAISELESLFKKINDEYYNSHDLRNAKLQLLIDLVYIELYRVYKNHQDLVTPLNQTSEQVKKLLKLVDQNFKMKKFAKEYADMMNMSVRHLSRITNQQLNKSTTDIITERIILEAKRMLVHNVPTIKAVADEVGYLDSSYFVRLFKKKTGMSPKEFQYKTVDILSNTSTY